MNSRLKPEPRTRPPLAWRNAAQFSAWQHLLEKSVPALTIAVVYFLGVRLGFEFSIASQPLSAICLSNAVVMAFLLVLPRASWPSLLLCILPAHMLAYVMDQIPVSVAFSRYFTNIGEALIGAALIHFFAGSHLNFARLRDTCVFLLGGVICAPLLSSVLDVILLQMVEAKLGPFQELWRNRVLANAVSILVLVPPIIVVMQRKSLQPAWKTEKRRVEAGVLAAVLFSICVIGIITEGAVSIFHGSILFALFPIMIWSSVRFDTGFVSLVTLVVAVFGVWGGQHWEGSFVHTNSSENLLRLYYFILFTAAPVLLLAAVIGEWRRADMAARKRKQQLDLALDAGKLGLWVWDIDSAASDWSVRINGVEKESDDAVAMPQFFRNVHPDDRRKLEQSLMNSLCSAEPFELELRIAQDDSQFRWFLSRGSWQFNADGKPYQLLGVNADITQHKNEYAQIQRQRDELAHLNRVAMLGEMSGAIAHELNQPLTAILSNAQAALRMLQKLPPHSSEVVEILADIVSEDKRASDIIRRMREFIKKGPAKVEPVDINGLLGKAIALERSDLTARNVAINTSMEMDLPLVTVDAVQVLQVFLNLLINACDAMQDRPINERLIQVATSHCDEKSVLITVSDHGKGIAEDQLETIFEPFFTSKSHGLGLGLTICRSIIEAHGGRLWAKNNREGGATFNLMLPVIDK